MTELSPLLEHCTENDRVQKKSDNFTLLACSSTMFGVNCVVSIVAPFFPLHAKENNNASETTIGLIFATYPVAIFLTSWIWAMLCLKIGKKAVLGIGLLLLSGTTIAFGFCNSIPLYFIVRFLQGVGAGGAGTASAAILTETFPEKLGLVIGIMEMCTGLGFIFGPPIGGLLYQADGFYLPFLVIGILPVPLLLMLPFLDDGQPEDSVAESSSSHNFRFLDMFSFQFVLVTLGVSTGTCALSFTEPILAQHLNDLLGLNATQVGLIFIVPGILYAGFSPVVGIIGDKYGYKPLLVGGFLLIGFSFLLLGPAPFLCIPNDNKAVNWVVQIIALACTGIGVAVGLIPTLPLMKESVRHLGPKATVYVASIFNSFVSIGEGLGPLLGGVLAQKLGFATGCLVFAAMLISYAVVFAVFWAANCFDINIIEEEGTEELIQRTTAGTEIACKSLGSLSRTMSGLGVKATTIIAAGDEEIWEASKKIRRFS